MRKHVLLLLLLVCSVIQGQNVRKGEELALNRGWLFAQSGQTDWRSAVVPGTVQQDLLRHNLLPNPFFGTNEQRIQWVEKEDWEYKTTFILTAEQLAYDAALLVFEGLDTYADVYLNGSPVLKSDNMFVGYALPVKAALREGENKLHVYFHSPIHYVLPQWRSNGFEYPADNDHHPKHVSVYTRKAPYHYGWDWGIRMVTSGIWRPVKLQLFDVAHIDDYYVRQLSVTSAQAKVKNEIVLNAVSSSDASADVIVSYSLNGGEKNTVSKSVLLQPGSNKIDLLLDIANPALWMPNGWGKPALYDFTVQVQVGGTTVAECHQRIGLRSIQFVNEKDSGESYYFLVNGEPMFAKGANYIPGDAMLPNVSPADYQRLFADVKAANMNMIRVWGGGSYENDLFYELADENGILVWQDFMFACTAYPSDPAFLKRVEQEADYNIRRLRNHASLAMWCGNNEILEGLKYWGWKKSYQYSDQVYSELTKGYDTLFKELLSNKVKELDPERSYVHGSPYRANWGRPESLMYGDSHYWGVWYGEEPFEIFDERVPRFMSEFGFQSFPEMKTIAAFADPKDYEIESEVMKAHQKSSIGNSLIKKYMGMYYHVPMKFEDFVYVGLVLQGQGMRHGFEAHRRNKPYCMGTLYWQLNDSWPVVSWSGIDYYGNWKALHYQAQRAFAPILINPVELNDTLYYYLISDQLKGMDGTLETRKIDFDGKVLSKHKLQVSLAANSSQLVYRIPKKEVATAQEQTNSFLQLRFNDLFGKPVAEELFFFTCPKKLNLPETTIRYTLKESEGCYELTLSSPKLAKDVFIEIPIQGARFSDNFFDLLPGEKKKVIITSPELKKGRKEGIQLKHLRQTY